MSGIGTMNIPGISTGLDTAGIIEKLMSLERRPYYSLEKKVEKLELKKELFQEVNTKALELQALSFELTLDKTYHNYTVDVSNEGIVDATINGLVNPDVEYVIDVTQLARKHTIASDQQTQVGNNDESLGYNGGTFSINGVEITIGDNFSLEDIRDLINGEKRAGVTASIVNKTLMIESNESGSANTISLSDVSGTVLQDLGIVDGLGNIKNEVYAPQDAIYSVNGLSFTGDSNELDGVIEGLSITLEGIGTTHIRIENDIDSTVDKIKNFVEKYNEMMNYLADKITEKPLEERIINSVTDDEKRKELLKKGLLSSDRLLIKLQTDLRNEISRVVGSLSIEDIGLMTKGMSGGVMSEEAKRGIIELDEEKIRNALKENPDKVMALFKNPGEINEVKDEFVGYGSSSDTVYYLDNKNIGEDVVIKVGGNVLREVSSNPGIGEFMLDHNTGVITLGEPPFTGDNIEASYTYYNGVDFSSDSNQLIADGTGYNKTFFIGARYIKDGVRISVDGNVYEEVANKDDLTSPNQYYLDHDTGEITFFEAPANQAEIRATYDYMIVDRGIMWGINDILKEVSGVGEFYIEERAIDTEINDLKDRLEALETRLNTREATLWRQFTSLETTLGDLQNQSSWLAGQFAKLSS